MINSRLLRGAALTALLATVPLLRASDVNPTQERADRFLMLVNASYQALGYVSSEAQWKASTDVNDVHDAASETAGKALAAFMGNPAIINETKALLLKRHDLNDLTVRELERQLLESVGYRVDVAVDGVDGWNTVRGEEYDLVISDVDMPRMDGIQFVSRIKQDAGLRSIPVVIVSYKDREEDRMRGLDAGANAYLTKSSFRDQTFLRTVEDLIGEATG